MKRLKIAVFCMMGAAMSLGSTGCATGSYKGVEPFVDTFREDADVRDYYIGMNLNFALDDTTSHLPPAHSYDPDVR